MTPPPSLFHSLLRPAVLQILRAAGYHGAKTSVLDSMTDLAARYFYHLCELTAIYAAHNSSEDMTPTIVDIRMALQHVGALLPEKPDVAQEFLGIEDTRGTDEFIAWAAGALNKEIKRVALDGEDEATDYLNALKKKHSKNDDDTKYVGTLLGKPNEHGDVQVEGGQFPSIFNWEERLRLAAERAAELDADTTADTSHTIEQDGETQDVVMNGDTQAGEEGGEGSRPPSSGLSSLGDRSIGDEMDLS